MNPIEKYILYRSKYSLTLDFSDILWHFSDIFTNSLKHLSYGTNLSFYSIIWKYDWRWAEKNLNKIKFWMDNKCISVFFSFGWYWNECIFKWMKKRYLIREIPIWFIKVDFLKQLLMPCNWMNFNGKSNLNKISKPYLCRFKLRKNLSIAWYAKYLFMFSVTFQY